jgi:hypothetical protein
MLGWCLTEREREKGRRERGKEKGWESEREEREGQEKRGRESEDSLGMQDEGKSRNEGTRNGEIERFEGRR